MVHQPGLANSSHLMPGIRSALTSGGPSCHVWSCKGSSFALCLGSEWNWALRREAEKNHTLPSVHQRVCAKVAVHESSYNLVSYRIGRLFTEKETESQRRAQT